MNSPVPISRPLPYNIEAEEAVIGSLMIDNASIVRVIAELSPESFYREKHQWFMAAITALHLRGEPCDPVTLTDELERTGLLSKAGGPAAVTEFFLRVPTAIHLDYYAKIVRREWLRRQLVNAAEQIARLAYEDGEDLSDLFSRAESELYSVTQLHRAQSKPQTLAQLASRAQDRYDALYQTRITSGIPSASADLNDLLTGGGFQRKKLYVLAARPKMGKCLAKGTKVLMFDGSLRNVEDVRPDELLMGDDSTPRRVLGITQGREMMYWVRQNGAMDYRVNESHILSLKRSKNDGPHKHGDLLDISVRDWCSKGPGFHGRYKGYRVAVEFPEAPLLVPPYLLGLWLGDGTTGKPEITTPEPEIVDALNFYAAAYDWTLSSRPGHGCNTYYLGQGSWQSPHSFRAQLRDLGVLGCKRIPQQYLVNSTANRLRLLAGLVDTDGHYQVSGGQQGPYEITTVSPELANDIKFLVDSLGFQTSLITKHTSIKSLGYEGIAYRIRFNGDVDKIPVLVPRKQAKPWRHFKDWRMSGIRVEADQVDDYYGFELDGNGRFLLEDMTVTHNTSRLSFDMDYQAQQGYTVLFFSLEMDADAVMDRKTAAAAKVDLRKVIGGPLTEDEHRRVSLFTAEVVEGNRGQLIICDQRGMSPPEMEGVLRWAISEYGQVDMVYVDHLQEVGEQGLPSAKRRSSSTPDIVSEKVRYLRNMAGKYDVAVVLAAQLNREVEKRQDKTPALSDLKDSGGVEETADVVMFLYRDEYYHPNTERPGTADIIVAAQRNGRTGKVPQFFDPATGRWGDLVRPSQLPPPRSLSDRFKRSADEMDF